MSTDRPDDRDLAAQLGDDESEISGLLGHMYRAEMDRTTTWGSRLDQTTNWTVTVVAALLTWVFSSPDNPHYILLLGVGIVGAFHVIETRRYRFYDVWRARVRLLEQDLLAPMLDRETERAHPDWRRKLGADLRRQTLKAGFLEAWDRRLRRVYLPLFLVLVAAWTIRITAFTAGEPLDEAARIGEVPGVAVIAVVAAVTVGLLVVAGWPMEREAKGELHEGGDVGAWKEDEEDREEG